MPDHWTQQAAEDQARQAEHQLVTESAALLPSLQVLVQLPGTGLCCVSTDCCTSCNLHFVSSLLPALIAFSPEHEAPACNKIC